MDSSITTRMTILGVRRQKCPCRSAIRLANLPTFRNNPLWVQNAAQPHRLPRDRRRNTPSGLPGPRTQQELRTAIHDPVHRHHSRGRPQHRQRGDVEGALFAAAAPRLDRLAPARSAAAGSGTRDHRRLRLACAEAAARHEHRRAQGHRAGDDVEADRRVGLARQRRQLPRQPPQPGQAGAAAN